MNAPRRQLRAPQGNLKGPMQKKKERKSSALFLLLIDSAVKTCFAAFIERYSVGINRRCV